MAAHSGLNSSDRWGRLILGTISMLFGLVVLYLADNASDAAEKWKLREAYGTVESLAKGKSSVKFGLRGESRHFQFLSQGGDIKLVYQALSAAGNKVVTVLFDPQDHWQPPLSDQSYCVVYEIRIADQPLVTYDQAKTAWQSNRITGQWLGWALLLIGAGVTASGLRLSRKEMNKA